MKRWIVLACVAFTLVAGTAWGKESGAARAHKPRSFLHVKYGDFDENGNISVEFPDSNIVWGTGKIVFVYTGGHPHPQLVRFFAQDPRDPNAPKSYDLGDASEIMLGRHADSRADEVMCRPTKPGKFGVWIQWTKPDGTPGAQVVRWHPFDGPQVVIDATGGMQAPPAKKPKP